MKKEGNEETNHRGSSPSFSSSNHHPSSTSSTYNESLLAESHTRLLRVNQSLEEKVLRLIDSFHVEKGDLVSRINQLTKQVDELREENSRLTNQVNQLREDCGVAVQLLAANPVAARTVAHELYVVHEQQQQLQEQRSKHVQSGQQQHAHHHPMMMTTSTFPPMAVSSCIFGLNNQQRQQEQVQQHVQENSFYYFPPKRTKSTDDDDYDKEGHRSSSRFLVDSLLSLATTLEEQQSQTSLHEDRHRVTMDKGTNQDNDKNSIGGVLVALNSPPRVTLRANSRSCNSLSTSHELHPTEKAGDGNHLLIGNPTSSGSSSGNVIFDV